MDFLEISNLPPKLDQKMPVVKNYDANRNLGNFFDVFGKAKRNLGLLLDKKRFLVLIFFIFFVEFLLLARLFYLQIDNGDHYRSVADGNRIRVERIEAQRGIIYDANLKPLLKNSPNFSLQITPIDLPKDEIEFLELQNLLSKKIGDKIDLRQYISDNILENFQPRIIKEFLEYEQAIDLLVLAKNLKGVSIVIDKKREYQYKNYLAHILGYLGNISKSEYKKLKNRSYYLDDKIGKAGLEFIYEDFLRGRAGRKKIEVNSMGKEIKELAREEPIDGSALILSLDLDLQIKITNLLNNLLQKKGLKKASVVAINPQDGSVLALVSTPSFDNNIFSKKLSLEDYNSLINDEDRPMFFRAISGEYPPGSTFKIVMAAAGLESGIIDRNSSFLSVGGIRIGKWFFPDWKSGGHGMTNVEKALAQSVNTFFYNIGGGYQKFSGLGLDKINFYAREFGLAQKTGIDINNEADGFLPSREWKRKVKNESWYIGDTYHLSIGQGDILVTPLQVAMFTSVIANGGILYQPQLLKAIVDGQKQNNLKHKIKKEKFISKKNIEIVQSGLRKAVTEGSCRYLLTLPVKSAGKTGTAQHGFGHKAHAWFTGYAPYNHPEIVLTVLIEDGGEGSSVAVPLARDILLWYFNNRKDNE